MVDNPKKSEKFSTKDHSPTWLIETATTPEDDANPHLIHTFI